MSLSAEQIPLPRERVSTLCLGFLDARQARRWVCPRRRVSEKARSLTRGMAVSAYGELSDALVP